MQKKKKKKSEYECTHTINVRVSVWSCTYQSAHITTSKWPSSAETSASQSHLTTLWNTESRVEEPIELLVLRHVLRDTPTPTPPRPPAAETRCLSASLEPWMKCDGGKRCHLQGKERQLLTWHLTFIPCEARTHRNMHSLAARSPCRESRPRSCALYRLIIMSLPGQISQISVV